NRGSGYRVTPGTAFVLDDFSQRGVDVERTLCRISRSLCGGTDRRDKGPAVRFKHDRIEVRHVDYGAGCGSIDATVSGPGRIVAGGRGHHAESHFGFFPSFDLLARRSGRPLWRRAS